MLLAKNESDNSNRKEIMRIIFSAFIMMFTSTIFGQTQFDSLIYCSESKTYTLYINDSLDITYNLKTANYRINKSIDTLGYSEGIMSDTISFVSEKDSIVIICNFSSRNKIIEVNK